MNNARLISAAKYYVGTPDGKYFRADEVGKDVAEAKKAYVTINTLLGNDEAERCRFDEHKKQIPGLISPRCIANIFRLVYDLTMLSRKAGCDTDIETVRACRQSEVAEGESVVDVFTSTTKLSLDEIMKLGYGDKNELAICHYKFHEGCATIDMEKLGKDYLKPEEREVLLLIGNKISVRRLGVNEKYHGRDGKPAVEYEVEVFSPKADDEEELYYALNDMEASVLESHDFPVFRDFYEKLNDFSSDYPEEPANYRAWKESLKTTISKKVSFMRDELFYKDSMSTLEDFLG